MAAASGICVLDLGRRAYEEVHALQQELVAARRAGAIEDTLVLCEHDPVITLGRATREGSVLDASGVPVVEVERGGEATLHAPGQLVGYPIVDLLPRRRDLRRFLRDLEAALIAACADLGLEGAERREGLTGVWCRGRKLASIGIACRRWVTFHGFALNRSIDPALFARIRPCGLDASAIGSLERLLGRAVGADAAKAAVARRVSERLGIPARAAAPGIPAAV